MLTDEKLKTLLAYYYFTRQRGHTWSMVHGAINTSNPIILTGNENAKSYIKRYFPPDSKVTFVPWDSLEYLRGRISPLLVDNHAMMMILQDALRVIGDLGKRNLELVEKLNNMKPHYYESGKRR